MRPRSCAIITLPTARQQWKTPSRLSDIPQRQAASGCSTSGAIGPLAPAELTRMSMPPKSCSTCCVAASTAARAVGSQPASISPIAAKLMAPAAKAAIAPGTDCGGSSP